MNRKKISDFQTEANHKIKFRIVAIAAKSSLRLSRLVTQSKECKLIDKDIENVDIENYI